MAGGDGMPPWPVNQTRPAHNVDLRRSWVPSPVIPARDAEHERIPAEDEPSSASTSTRSARSTGSGRRKHSQRTRRAPGDDTLGLDGERGVRRQSWLACFRPMSLFSRRSRVVDSEVDDAEKHTEERHLDYRREVAPAEWRAYGYWARPYINWPWAIRVNNATPLLENQRELSPPEVDAMLATIREPGGAEAHPENWVPRVSHPSLPPRPDLWPTPQATFSPLPGELQLNPWFTHRAIGTPPLHFDLRLRAADAEVHVRDALYRTGRRDALRVDGPNGAQPATYPGVPRLRVTALAGDAQPWFWWPFTVLAHHAALPVQVRDVLDALVANFEERLSVEEWQALSDERKHMVRDAYVRRCTLPVGGRVCPPDDGARRVDYLGDNFCFRGFEPAPDGDGFMMFVGPPP
ncbi:uncharacterized protein TRAVEDRAFT_152987 [Trametes versicolor FP-101664 SS1]|uniref:uncharacterized protein n=1 Tax=Trametes versicolor (strain FP-101664) TaxID=717944 RepID=UPI0004624738|nr:uncharacterized protein TRAVEDRAFT_152987 [Trametes versicolor FP-101664 SS1]EIW54714.1 hypothetical protein TRAVEDRAFT_152987 [Trametes versicolor FP-101664 SS1]